MAANAIVRFITTKAAKLSSLDIRDGQLIFVSDTRHIYLDFSGVRVCYDCIKVLSTEQDRLDLLAPVEGFYFVQETNIIWKFSTIWLQITPNDLKPIILGVGVEDFPEIGNPQRLYIANDGTYKWDENSQVYKMVANLTQWLSL